MYWITSPRRSKQKSRSMSGMEMRSGFRNRSNSRSNLRGSISVMASAYATSEPAAEPRPGPTGMPRSFAGYFLIVYDIVKAAKDRGIPVGPGRGSAAGSLVAYALAITDIDPLKFDLLFERFLNPERISMPDIDLDFCFERRGEVIQYIRERYGRDSVGQIITFGTLKARAAFRDVARTLRVEPGEVDRFTKMIPAGPGISVTLAEASEKSPELRQLTRQDERVRKILELGTRIEGLARHASVHAAGVVIAPGPLTDYVPVCLAPQEAEAIITQYDMVALEQVGMLKIDVLGLRTLTVIHDAVRMVAERHGIQHELGRLIERALALGHDRRGIEDIAAKIETFGRYGFNKSHAVAYSVLSYQTAWLKAHYAPEFLSALLSSEIGNTDNVVRYINEARELGLEVLPPDVNESGFKFTVVGERRLRFGLGAIKNVGAGAIESILAGRTAGGPYRSLIDLCDRIDLRLCNKRVLEALIDAGACDSLGGHRAQLVAALDDAFGEAQARQQERQVGQHGLFGEQSLLPAPRSPLPDLAPWSEHDRLVREKAVLGFFISGHPLARYRVEVELFGTRTTATLGQWSEQRVRIGAVVTVVKRQISKKTGAEYARLTLEDFHGTAEALGFPEAWAKLNEVIRTDRALLFAGGYSARDRDEEQAPFIVETAQGLDELKASGAIGIALRWSPGAPPLPDATRAVAALCAAHPGPAPVLVEWQEEHGNGGGRFRSRSLRVDAADDLVVALRALLGPDHVHLVRTT